MSINKNTEIASRKGRKRKFNCDTVACTFCYPVSKEVDFLKRVRLIIDEYEKEYKLKNLK